MVTQNLQKPFPFRLKKDSKAEDMSPEAVLKELPKILPESITEKEFSIGNRNTGEIHARYLLCQELAQQVAEETSGTASHPIYLIDPKEIKDEKEIYNLNVEIVAAPPSEKNTWEKIRSLKEIIKEEKLKKKEELAEELAQIPKEEIWEGFKSEKKDGLPDSPLTGYRSGSDPKKWWMQGIGNPWADIWIIGLYPSNEEIKAGRVYAGRTGKEITSILEDCGINPETEVYMDNLIKRYMPAKSKLGVEVKLEQMWLLRRQLSHYRPSRVICLGTEAFKELVGTGYKFSNMRGNWINITYPLRKPEEGYKPWTGRVSGTFHPAGCLRPEGRKNLPLLRTDLKNLILDNEQKNVEPNNKEIRTLEATKKWVESELRRLDALPENEYILYGLDTEGYGAAPNADKFICIQYCPVICEVAKNPMDYSMETKGTWIQAPKVNILPKLALKETYTLLFREHLEPERISKEAFEFSRQSALQQISLFDLPSTEDANKSKKPGGEETSTEEKEPIFEVATSEEQYKKIFEKHQKRKESRDLVVFRPDKAIPHLEKYNKEVGEQLLKISTHPKMAGFVLTNANYDRVRIEKQLGHDLLANCAVFDSPLDSMLAEHITNENNDLGLKPSLNRRFGWPRQDKNLDLYAKVNRLDVLAKKITGDCVPHASAWALFPWNILKPYAAKDAYGVAALLVEEFKEMLQQEQIYQPERVKKQESNTLRQAFYISCSAINGTYEMHREGMPVGEKGFEILNDLTRFYAKHEKELVKEYQDMVYKLSGFHDANPSSSEELTYILFDEKSPLPHRGIEPWKESGNKGRLWEELSEEERKFSKPSTDGESLEIIASNCPDPEIQNFLIRLSEIKTILTIREDFLPDIQYGISKKKGLVGRLNLETLSLHTSYTPTLDTARCRSVPQLSTFPKGEEKRVKKILGEAPPYKIREIVCAPKGAKLLNCDWMTAEVLALGYLSGDPNMMSIISKMIPEKWDFHCKLAIPSYPIIKETISLMADHITPPLDWLNATVPEGQRKDFVRKWETFCKGRQQKNRSGALTTGETHEMTKILFKQERSNIKPVTFGVPYGRSAKAIMKQLNREYYVEDVRGPDGEIVKVTLEEAQAMIDSYKITEFSVAWNYLEDQAKQAIDHGYLKDSWGYIRHFTKGMREDEVTRKAYNYQIQHLVAAVMNMAMADWTRRRQQEALKSYAYATLYDNIGWVVYEDETQKIWDLAHTVMTTERPVGPKDGEKPEMANWHFPIDPEFSETWEGETIDPSSLGIDLKPERNLTGLE